MARSVSLSFDDRVRKLMSRRAVSSRPKATTNSTERRAACCAPHALAFCARKASKALVAASGRDSGSPMRLTALSKMSSLSAVQPAGSCATALRSTKAKVSRLHPGAHGSI